MTEAQDFLAELFRWWQGLLANVQIVALILNVSTDVSGDGEDAQSFCVD